MAHALTLAAPAKINLYLHVTGKRDDGYHLLDSLVAFASVHDRLTIEADNDLSLTNAGPFGALIPDTPDNLVLRAACRLREMTGISAGARITLEKNLPVASGIGGGSADAAAAIKGLAQLWELNPSQHDLSGLALDLGADVPVCLFGRPAFMGGIGEQIEPVPALPETPMVLVNPGVEVSTPAIFRARRHAFSAVARFDHEVPSVNGLIELLRDKRGNDLTEPAIRTEPVIGEVIAAIGATKACRLARMSGSGATCFGLYERAEEAAAAAAEIKRFHPSWWCVSSKLMGQASAT